MSSDTPDFQNPLVTRYASREMITIWSASHRYGIWRRIWHALACAQHEQGLPVSAAQVAALAQVVDAPIDFTKVAEYESQVRHDVMAHIHALGDAAPEARGIIHLGATSMDIVDNADLILMREALALLRGRLAAACRALANFAAEYADHPTLGFTHLQPAQLTTVGKRATLWLNELCTDLETVARLYEQLRCRGLRGATGTQAAFLKLLRDEDQVDTLERRFAELLGFDACYPVCGQTYSRKVDIAIIGPLGSLAASTQRICNDIRLLAMLKEVEEPFGKQQVGSSAMAYKRNPMLSERATGLARFLMSLAQSPFQTLAAQMLERTLDDSANKRLVVPEAFLAADALATLLRRIFDGLVVNPAVIRSRIDSELPFIATEDILMAGVQAGGDRQQLHERIREHSVAAAAEVKQHGRPNDLIERLRSDSAFAAVALDDVLDPSRYTGRAATQTRRFLTEVVEPLLARFEAADSDSAPIV